MALTKCFNSYNVGAKMCLPCGEILFLYLLIYLIIFFTLDTDEHRTHLPGLFILLNPTSNLSIYLKLNLITN